MPFMGALLVASNLAVVWDNDDSTFEITSMSNVGDPQPNPIKKPACLAWPTRKLMQATLHTKKPVPSVQRTGRKGDNSLAPVPGRTFLANAINILEDDVTPPYRLTWLTGLSEPLTDAYLTAQQKFEIEMRFWFDQIASCIASALPWATDSTTEVIKISERSLSLCTDVACGLYEEYAGRWRSKYRIDFRAIGRGAVELEYGEECG
jgi:hypothetical protein